MKKNLTARTVVIIVTILLCVYGIIGLPTSKAALPIGTPRLKAARNSWTN